MIKYHWDYYSELAIQRDKIKDQLNEVLLEKVLRNYQVTNWQRAVKYKYSLHPLSCVGSLKMSGRFNYGEDIGSNFGPFPALYLASDKDTALQETLGQELQASDAPLSAQELALSNPQSETIVSLSGELETVFELKNSKNIAKFVNLTKSFKVSPALKSDAKKLGLANPSVAVTAKPLFDSMMEKDWRSQYMLFDSPFNGQIFGHILYEAGINGVLYNSKSTKKDCLAVFPLTFENSNCYLKIDDDLPLEKVPKRIDSSNYKLTTLTAKEVFEIRGDL